MALVIGAVEVDSVPAGREEVVYPQAVRARFLGKRARVIFSADLRVCGSRSSGRREASKGQAFVHASSGAGRAIDGVTDDHAESLVQYFFFFSSDSRILTLWNSPV